MDAAVHADIRRQRGARLQLHALAYNLGNFLRTLATPEPNLEDYHDEPEG